MMVLHGNWSVWSQEGPEGFYNLFVEDSLIIVGKNRSTDRGETWEQILTPGGPPLFGYLVTVIFLSRFG